MSLPNKIPGVVNYSKAKGSVELREIELPKIGKNDISGYMGKEIKKVLYIQDHGNPVSYRNIWLRKL